MSRTFSLTILALASCFVASPAVAQETFAPDSLVRRLIEERISAGRGKGFVIGLLERGKPPRIHVAGSSGVEGLPLDDRTVFEIGSITKLFTSVLLAEMASRGEVKLDDPISRYLPRGVRPPARGGRQITLIDLATQTSGLPRLPSNLQPASAANPYADYSAEDLHEFLNHHTLTRDIGSTYEYSNLGVGLLGYVLALRAGRPYEALVKERVLGPLGMTETSVTLSPALQSRFAAGFNAVDAKMQPWDFQALAAAGALRSTMNDMLKFLAAALDSSASPLGGALARTMRIERPADRPGNSVGLGWHVVDLFGTEVRWHNGGTGGFRAFIGLDDARGRGVVILANSTISPDDIGFHLLERKVPLDLPRGPPPVRTAIELDPSKLDRLAGTYELAPAFRITVTKEDGALYGQATGQGKVRLHPESESLFFVKEVDAQIEFVIAPDGSVSRLVLHQGGARIPGTRVAPGQ